MSTDLLMSGPPGAGKTPLARTVPSIQPRLTVEEALDVTKICSVAGLLPRGVPVVARRPFRALHHTTSHIGLVGGGRFPRPGEISLGHRGVLFLDELPEFGQYVLEVHPSEGRGLYFRPAPAREPRDRASAVAQYAAREDNI